MTFTSASVIDVHAWGHWVGRLAQNPASGYYAFAYTPQWRDAGIELAPLHMPLSAAPYEFPLLPEATFSRLPALIADALPDRFGNAVVDAWMAERGVDRSQVTPLDRLAYAGSRGMGALTFEPADGPGDEAPPIVQVADLVVAARATVNGDGSTQEGLADALRQLIQVGTSAGGARAKAVIRYNRATGQIRSGHAPHEAGFVDYLLKLDGVSARGLDGRQDELADGAPYGRIEYAYYLMARAAEVEMAPSELLLEGPRAHFLTRRFDRGPGGERHHIVTLCALDHLDFNQAGVHSYDQYLGTVRRMGLGPDALQQAFRRMVFNVAGANRDDHTKNLSFLLPQDGRWQLAPAYDLTFAHSSIGRWTQRHQMTVNGRTEGIGVSDLHAVGERNDVPAYRRVVREVLAAVADWGTYAGASGVPQAETDRIARVMDRFRPA